MFKTMRFLTIFCVFLVFYGLTACQSDAVKLNRGDRERIDTTANKLSYDRAKFLDSLCQDSTPVWQQRAIDSLLQIREREIMMQTQPSY
jgi:peroxiredoxin family protein